MARGQQSRQLNMLAAINPDDRVPADHLLRRIKQLAGAALQGLSPSSTR